MADRKVKGLGKGLEALFGDVEIRPSETGEEYDGEPRQDGALIQYVDINDIKPNSTQPRQVFNEEKIDELAASIAAHGVIQPILLRKSGGGFEIVAGERRWRAARKAGLKQVPGMVKELTQEQLMIVALIENIQREDLNPMEEAEAFQKMCSEFGFTQEDVSFNVGKSRPYITNSLRLLRLPEEIQKMVLEGKLTNGHARALLSAESIEKQFRIAEKIIADGLSVRETEKLAREASQKSEAARKKNLARKTDIIEIEAELKEILGTKVTLKHKGKGGKLEIGYFSREELERLIEIFRAIKAV
ncbi:MAG: ParB/RepB/Spo0J family partition protein [Clostridiales bacterium]|nr:ParB/RepB/Spo0J family partition protein [Clostridiales bacterium]